MSTCATVSDATPTTRAEVPHIEIPGDTLIPDEEFCRLVLGGSTRRTAARHELEGLPYILIRGRKYRPLKAGREWLAARIQAQTRPQRRRQLRERG
jgi:hypothetical protein